MIQKYFIFLSLFICVHLNTMTFEELKRILPGMSAKKLQNVIEYRHSVGEFYSIYEFEFIKGFGAKFVDQNFEKITTYFCL